MYLYLISYDLIKDKNYDSLFHAIHTISIECARPLKSGWLIKHNGTAYDIACELNKYIDADDKLIVNRLDKDSSWSQSLGPNTTKWIQDNL